MPDRITIADVSWTIVGGILIDIGFGVLCRAMLSVFLEGVR